MEWILLVIDICAHEAGIFKLFSGQWPLGGEEQGLNVKFCIKFLNPYFFLSQLLTFNRSLLKFALLTSTS